LFSLYDSPAKTKKAPPPPQVVWPYETGPEVFASQKLQGVFPNTSPKGGT